jgi:hypothetical protein
VDFFYTQLATSQQDLPVLLDGLEKPTVLTYSLESIISEKLDAIIRFMEATGRMKEIVSGGRGTLTRAFDVRCPVPSLTLLAEVQSRGFNTPSCGGGSWVGAKTGQRKRPPVRLSKSVLSRFRALFSRVTGCLTPVTL